MTSTCPACNKSVDPLRSRFVRVVAAKVVAYCSAECAGRHSAPETSRTISPATGVPMAIPTPPSGVPARATPPAGVPVRATPAGAPARATPPAGVPVRNTPAAGVPVPVSLAATSPAAAPERRTPAAGIPVGPPLPMTPAAGVPINLDSGPVIEILHEPTSGVVTSARDERPARAKHPDEISIAEFWSADKERSAAEPDSGPVKARDDTLDKWTMDTADHAERAASEGEAAPRRGTFRLVVLVVLLLAAGGLLVYQYLLKHDLAAATSVPAPAPGSPSGSAPGPPAVAAVAVEPARSAELPVEPPVVDPEAAVAQARATLKGDLVATSQRLQRIAAAALARTEDPAARDFLAAQLGLTGAPRAADAGELSDIARLDLAYSLARSGDKRGNDALAQALASQRAEARDEAARLLALLGDRRAAPHLTDLLAVTQRRLGAAEHLAHLGDPRALKVLEQLCADARTSADDKARATIALALAGRTAVAPSLRGMLGDPHFNAFAAAALAELKDSAARSVLEYQLDSPSLRVRAARALRRLDPDFDPRPVLPRLLDILKNGRDRDQIQAAEAILLLAGPARWSAFD